MKKLDISAFLRTPGPIAAVLLFVAGPSFGEALGPLVDDFGDSQNSSLGIQRLFLSDTTAGGGTTTEPSVSAGILSVRGEISPPRGQPGWSSSVLLLDAQGLPRDVSAFEGIRLRVKVNEGSISVSANSSEVTNYDYHAAPVLVTADGSFHEISIPFVSMKRAWSEQTPLDTTSILSLSIVAFGLQKGDYDFELDEVSFY